MAVATSVATPVPTPVYSAGRAPVKEKEKKIYLPDTLAEWPWPRAINPHYAEAKEESQAWAASFNAFSPKAQHAFNRCDFSTSFRNFCKLFFAYLLTVYVLFSRISSDLLASLAYPLATKRTIRCLCPQ